MCFCVLYVSGSSASVALPDRSASNLCFFNVPIYVSQYCMAMSRLVSVAVQKYGGNFTHPICNDDGTTIFIDSPGACGSTYAKFHSSPAWASRRQKPSLISHFAMKILSFLSASANTCMICCGEWPIWFIAPLGAVFVVESFTDGRVVPSRSRSEKDRSNINRNAFNLYGIAVIGETLICVGWLSFISSHSTIVACPMATFLAASCLKCLCASTDSAGACGPCSTASHFSAFVHGFPVFAGHP
jgi:hypothetical protein